MMPIRLIMVSAVPLVTVHAMNLVTSLRLPVPLPLLPVVGGLAGLAFGILFGAARS
jgi:hypothetical protein